MEMQVSLDSQGLPISGVLHLPAAAGCPGVVMCHGFTGSKSEAHRLFVNAARDFCDHGIAALRFDFRGSGDSAGEFRDMTVSGEIADAQEALNYLAARPEINGGRVGILGLSLGGCVAACLAGQEPRIKSLVLWAATCHPEDLHARLKPEFAERDLIDFDGWGLGRGFLDDLLEVHPLAQAANYRGPALIIHGEMDETVPLSHARDYERALGGSKRVQVISGASHVFSHLQWKAEAIMLSRRFLLDTLGKG